MSAIYVDRALAVEIVEKLRIYAQPQRLMILSCLLRGGRTVGEIEMATSIGQPALSQQLAELRRGDMVRSRRAARQVYYDLAGDQVALCVRGLEAIFCEKIVAASDLAIAVAPPAKIVPAALAAGAAAFARIER